MGRKFDKLEVARRQLGTALQLFIDDQDPVSVHNLASAGAEIAHGLAEAAGIESFQAIATEANAALSQELYTKLRTQFWNGFKHYQTKSGVPRDDADLFAVFSDEANEIALLVGWLDLGRAMGCMPIEAQVFQGWYFARYPDLLGPERRPGWYETLFQNVDRLPRNQHKEVLRKAIAKVRRAPAITSSPLTDRRKLLLPNNLDELER